MRRPCCLLSCWTEDSRCPGHVRTWSTLPDGQGKEAHRGTSVQCQRERQHGHSGPAVGASWLLSVEGWALAI